MTEQITPTATPTQPIPGPRGLAASVRAARGLTGDPCPALDQLAAEHGRTFGVALGPLKLLVVGDPVHLRDVFATPTDAYLWGHRYNVLGFIVGRTSLIVSDGEDHRRRRGKVQPGFARRRLDGWAPMIMAETDRAIDAMLQRDGAFDFYPIGKHLVLDIVVQAFFGAGLRSRADEIDGIYEHLQGYIELPGYKQIPHPVPGTMRARARTAHEQFNHLVDTEIARRRNAPDRTDTDLLDALLDDESDEALRDEEIRDQVNTLIGAGYHTTAASLSWITFRAAGAPQVWQQLRDEADEVLGPDGVVGPETVTQLRYAGAVVHEGLRLHPAGVFAPRQAVRDVAVGPFSVPKGTMILWSSYLAGRDPEVWDDPLEFRPERHLDPDPAQAAAMEAAWVPFGRGPRRCIGFAMAQLELTLALARLAQRVDLTLESPTVPRPYGVVVNRPDGGVIVRAGARSHP